MSDIAKLFNDYVPPKEESNISENLAEISIKSLKDSLIEIKNNAIMKISKVLVERGLTSEDDVKEKIEKAIVEITNRVIDLKQISYEKLQSSFGNSMMEISKNAVLDFEDSERTVTNKKIPQILDTIISDNIIIPFYALLDPMREGNNSEEKKTLYDICSSNVKDEFLAKINIEDKNIAEKFSGLLDEKIKSGVIKDECSARSFFNELREETVSKSELSKKDAQDEPKFNDDDIKVPKEPKEKIDIQSYFNS